MPKTKNNKSYAGLTQRQAEKALMDEGFNELPSQKKQSGFEILLSVIREPMILLLVVAGTIYLILGELKDALILVTFILFDVGITFYQEHKTEKTLDALRNLSSPRALVVRDGEQKRISGREVVKGDLIFIREGDRVPADAVVLECENLNVDESLLTGESVPVRKSEGLENSTIKRPGGDDLSFVYSGTLVVSGRGFAKVLLTGIDTEIGKIGKSLESINSDDTLLKKEISKIVRWLGVFGIFICVIFVTIYFYVKGDMLDGFLAGLALSMSMLPEEFPVVLIIFLTLGAWRISKKKVLTRRPAVIETLGAATVLCTDKTGTLTMNKMKLEELYFEGDSFEFKNPNKVLPGKFEQLLKVGFLSSQEDPFDPIEKEIKNVCQKYSVCQKGDMKNFSLVKEYPLSRELIALSHAWDDGKKGFLIASKGSPEAILDLCHVDNERKKKLLKTVDEMSEKGLRVLGAAKAEFLGKCLPKNQHDFKFEFMGFFGFVDPPRKNAKASIRRAYEAGMRVIMITGDYPGTAQFIARKIGIKNPEKFITGEEMGKMRPYELKNRIKENNIFARVAPEQKLLIVDALKSNNEVVAMTGDGVNDAPALKAADIGISMGQRGTDVAREASSLVLLNDDFSSIVEAVRLGRRVYSNIRKASGYILAVHIPIAGMSLLPLLFNFPAVLLPVHIAFLELIIDPACSTVFESEKESSRTMHRPPRKKEEPLFNRKMIGVSLLQGLGIVVAAFLLFLYAINSGKGEEEIRSFAFVSLVIANLMLIATNLSWHESIYRTILMGNKVFLFVFGGALACLLTVLYTPFFSESFHLAPLSFFEFAAIAAVSMSSLLWFEIIKALKWRFY